MIDFGTVRPGSTLYIPFATYDSNDPAASVTLTGLATTDIEIYKDGSTTQRASDAGFALLDTDGIDFDGVTGIHGFSVDLADNTTAGFYAAGSQYWIVVASVTVDAGTVNFIAATFRIGYPQALLNTTIATLASQTSFTLTNGPAEDDALNGMLCLIHDVASGVQVGQAIILDYTGATKTVTLAAGTTFTAAATDNLSVIGPAPLQPTTSGNKLDVATTGEAGLDYANVNISDGPNSALGWIESGTLQSGTASTAVLRSATSFVDDLILGSTIYIRSGTGAGQSRYIYDWVSASDTASVSPDWTTTPDNTSIYAVIPTSPAPTHSSTLPNVNVTQISGDTTAADNAEAFFDGTGYAGTNNVIPTVTTLTNLPAITANWLTAAGTAADFTAEIQSGLATAAELAKVPKSDGTATWNATALASIQAEATDALNAYDPPTNAEMETRTPTAAQLAYIVANAATGLPVTFITAGGSTTAAVLALVDGASPSATDDQYNGRLLVFTDGTLKGVVTDITDYVGATTTATITAVPTAPTSSHNARLI